jgi:Protein of unknown function (DUF2911)
MLSLYYEFQHSTNYRKERLTMRLRLLATAACCAFLTTASLAQMGDMKMDQPAGKALPSPTATAQVSLNGKQVKVNYHTPSMRGRKIMGGLVPYGVVWRTGANDATTLITATNLKIGTLEVPAGTYTLYTLPSASQWLLIVNKQTGQWGTTYNQPQDLGRTPMQAKMLPAPQETMSISFENTKGAGTELHVKWEKADEFVTVQAQ